MSGNKMIPVEESFAEWRKDPAYVKAYNALEDEFSLAAEMIRARASAGLTQEQLAQRMNTTQAVIARLESGRVKPSTRTLERLAAATGMKLRISFEPGTAMTVKGIAARRVGLGRPLEPAPAPAHTGPLARSGQRTSVGP